MSVATLTADDADPIPAADIAYFQGHPGFRDAVERYCAANLARYHALAPIERWMVSDMGRASLSGTVIVKDATEGLTPGILMNAPVVASGEVSRGRARLYLQRALANDLIEPIEAGAEVAIDTPLRPSTRLLTVMVGWLTLAIRSAATLKADTAPALDRLDDPAYVRRMAAYIGAITPALHRLFPLDCPVQMFQSRDGGTRLLEELMGRQRPGRERLLEACAYSHSALARGIRCSRAHVIQLLKDGEARGFLDLQPRRLTVAPVLSEDAELYYATLFATARVVATWALAEA